MRWLDATSPEEATQRAKAAASIHQEALREGHFWADEIDRLKDQTTDRLQLALDNLPLPAAFHEAAVALRAIIRDARKNDSDWHSPLRRLYELAAYRSFMLDYALRLKQPGYNVMDSIPGKVVQGLEFCYDGLGYQELHLLNKTDAKWMVEAWGEPTEHTTLHVLHLSTWDRFEDALIEKQKQASKSFFDDLMAMSEVAKRKHPGEPLPDSPRSWWKFW